MHKYQSLEWCRIIISFLVTLNDLLSHRNIFIFLFLIYFWVFASRLKIHFIWTFRLLLGNNLYWVIIPGDLHYLLSHRNIFFFFLVNWWVFTWRLRFRLLLSNNLWNLNLGELRISNILHRIVLSLINYLI